jgi:sterol desaturase/sphingolipid hydroxylase (fatty acid hydroxylase superfamily)
MPVKLIVVIVSIFSLLILENKWPFFSYKTSPWSRIVNNFELGAINSIASSLLAIAISRTFELHGSSGIIAMIPSPAIAGALAFGSLDLYMYFWHRMMHTLPIAWRFHLVHHTDRQMNVSTAYRFHPIEIMSSSLPKLFLIWLLGIPSSFVLIYESVFTIIVALHHSNFALPSALDRILAYLILTPHYHRIHHSQVVAETNSNYASVFIWWDRLFGTYRDRQDIQNIQLGISEASGDLNLLQSLALPLPDRKP